MYQIVFHILYVVQIIYNSYMLACSFHFYRGYNMLTSNRSYKLCLFNSNWQIVKEEQYKIYYKNNYLGNLRKYKINKTKIYLELDDLYIVDSLFGRYEKFENKSIDNMLNITNKKIHYIFDVGIFSVMSFQGVLSLLIVGCYKYIPFIELTDDFLLIESNTVFILGIFLFFYCLFIALVIVKEDDLEEKENIEGMKLKIYLKSLDDKDLMVRFNGEEEQLFNDSSIEFTFLETGDYELELYSEKSSKNMSFLMKIGYLIILPVMGIIKCIFQDTRYNWKTKIEPYCIHAIIHIHLTDSEILEVKYKNSRYQIQSWEKGKISIIPDYEMDVVYNINTYGIQKEFITYVRHILSIYSISLYLLGFILILAIVKEKMFMILFVAAIFILEIIFLYLTIKKEYKEKRLLEENFKRWIDTHKDM